MSSSKDLLSRHGKVKVIIRTITSIIADIKKGTIKSFGAMKPAKEGPRVAKMLVKVPSIPSAFDLSSSGNESIV